MSYRFATHTGLTGFGGTSITPPAPVPFPPAPPLGLSPTTLDKPLSWAAGAHVDLQSRKNVEGASETNILIPFWEGIGGANSIDQRWKTEFTGSPTWSGNDGIIFSGGDNVRVPGSNVASHPLKIQFPITVECICTPSSDGPFAYTIWTNDQKPASYSGLNLEVGASTFAVLIGDGGSPSSGSRRSSADCGTVLFGQQNHLIWSFASLTSWQIWTNGLDVTPSISGSGSSMAFSTNYWAFGLDGRSGMQDYKGVVNYFAQEPFVYSSEYRDFRFRNPFHKLQMPI